MVKTNIILGVIGALAGIWILSFGPSKNSELFRKQLPIDAGLTTTSVELYGKTVSLTHLAVQESFGISEDHFPNSYSSKFQTHELDINPEFFILSKTASKYGRKDMKYCNADSSICYNYIADDDSRGRTNGPRYVGIFKMNETYYGFSITSRHVPIYSYKMLQSLGG